jgi:hypothetical protein
MFCEDSFFREKDVLDAQSVSVRRYSYRATNEEAVDFDQGLSFNGPVQIDTYLIANDSIACMSTLARVL